uniref:Uncharacterized protein n=1 Tax=Minutocellus polymorphus TaxID=265543 RepID=A0A7S0AJR2_9STRA|mmetsp:Transcript_15488/g.25822  ORF Transcript_15488/g.25822 Transcript_15488/m.25822 type:complete len:188 (+) Transcript_15488:538-1101(+)
MYCYCPTFTNETKMQIMTGYASNSGNDPISIITIGTLNDMGYSVNYDVSDPYTIPTPVDCGAASRRRLTTQTNVNLKGGFLNWNQRGVRHISRDGRILSEGATLSQEGFDLATSHGKQVLSNSKKQRPGHEQGNAVFVGHMHTDVWYKEGDTIFLVDVAGDCGESTEYCEYHAECCSKNCLSNKCTT